MVEFAVKQLYTISDIARRWKISRARTYQLFAKGRITPDYLSSSGPLWVSIPEKPEKGIPGRVPKNHTRI